MFSLDGRVAVVTGAAGLIGKEISRTMLKQGATVIMLDLNKDALESARHEISENGSNSIVYVCDITDIINIEQAISDILSLHKKIDILVNNAGITRDMLFARMKLEDYDAVMNVNLRSTFIMTQKVLPNMVANRFGRIINISSVVGFLGNIGQANYCASKAGMVGMTKAIASEVARRGITANCVAPGFIKSAMTDTLSDAVKEKIIDKIPMGYIGDAKDIADAVCYLASNEASYITGQTLHVNGGMAMI